MKTNEQVKQPMNNWVEAGFAKERDELTRDVFKQCIGTSARAREREVRTCVRFAAPTRGGPAARTTPHAD